MCESSSRKSVYMMTTETSGVHGSKKKWPFDLICDAHDFRKLCTKCGQAFVYA